MGDTFSSWAWVHTRNYAAFEYLYEHNILLTMTDIQGWLLFCTRTTCGYYSSKYGKYKQGDEKRTLMLVITIVSCLLHTWAFFKGENLAKFHS